MTNLHGLVGGQHLAADLGQYEPAVEQALARMAEHDVLARIWDRDHTVWQDESDEITNRLGWLHSIESMQEQVGRLESLAEDVRAAGYTDALLLGMGGSSLAPELFAEVFGPTASQRYLDLKVLDSTDPAAVLAAQQRLDPARTLFVVASKSGTTVETLSFFRYFYAWLAGELDDGATGAHFVAITDPGSPLVDTAAQHGFRATFLNDPDIGGRYSALSHFGLVPAALVGVNVQRLLDRALAAARSAGRPIEAADNPAARLGAVLGELANSGRDKATFVVSPAVAKFGDWVEQLIAESTGKAGTGILPVVGEPVGPPTVYGDDRLFIHLHLEGDTRHDAALAALCRAGQPLVRLRLHDRYDLGRQFFLWEMATAIAGYRLGINPFNQPNVEAAKKRARKMVDAYQKTGSLPASTPTLEQNGMALFGDVTANSMAGGLLEFVDAAGPGAYIAFQAYLPPSPATDAALLALRHIVRDRTKRATTVGYGPRYLHSTGQLHKGDAGNGHFVQFTWDAEQDAAFPDAASSSDAAISFSVLEAAQAQGDRQALEDAGRHFIRIHLGTDAVAGLQQLIDMIK
jgi:transaldolase/glucose-6-phosphate isomerase